MSEQAEHKYWRFIYEQKTRLAVIGVSVLGAWASSAHVKTTPERQSSQMTTTSPVDLATAQLVSLSHEKHAISIRYRKLAPLPKGGYTHAQEVGLPLLPLEHAFEEEISAELVKPGEQASLGVSEVAPPANVEEDINQQGLIILENTTSGCAVMIDFIPNREGVFAQSYIAAYAGVITQQGVLEGAGNTESEVQHNELTRKEIPFGANIVLDAVRYAGNITISGCNTLPQS